MFSKVFLTCFSSFGCEFKRRLVQHDGFHFYCAGPCASELITELKSGTLWLWITGLRLVRLIILQIIASGQLTF